MSCNMSATYVGSTSDIIALLCLPFTSTTVNHPSLRYNYNTTDHGAPGSPAYALDYHSARNLLANFGSRPSLETPSVPYVAFRRCVNLRRITYFDP